MPEEKSILDEQQRQKVEQVFDAELAQAENPPVVGDYDDMGVYREALSDYNSKPLSAIVSDLRERSKQDTYDSSASEEVNAQNAEKYYQSAIKDMKSDFMEGVDTGIVDPDAADNMQRGIMSSLMRFPPDLIGVIKHVLLSLPIVGDSMAAFGKMIMSGGELSFSEAKAELTLEKSLAGGISNIGGGDDLMNQINQAYHNDNSVAHDKPAGGPVEDEKKLLSDIDNILKEEGVTLDDKGQKELDDVKKLLAESGNAIEDNNEGLQQELGELSAAVSASAGERINKLSER